MKKYKLLILLITCITVLSAWNFAWADVPTNNALEQIKNLYHDQAQDWSFILGIYAVRLFWALVLIDLAWMGIQLALNPGELSGFFSAFTRKVLFIGFFWLLLQPIPGGPAGSQARGIQWATTIVNSLVQAGGQANNWAGGTATISPAHIFDAGWNLCAQIIEACKTWKIWKSLPLLIGAIIIMIIFAMIAAMMLLMYVQSYIMIYAGVILLGFGGSVFTKDISLMYFRSALSVGVKLFIMILVVGLGQSILNQWIANFNVGPEQVILFIGAAVVLLALVKEVPNMAADLINGFSWGSGESLTHTSKQMGKIAAGTTIGAAAGALGGTMAVREATKLAGTQGASGAIGKSAAVGKNLATGAKDYAKGRLSGEVHKYGGTATGKVAAQVAKKHGLLKEEIATKKQEEAYINAQNTSTQNKDNNGVGSIGRDN